MLFGYGCQNLDFVWANLDFESGRKDIHVPILCGDLGRFLSERQIELGILRVQFGRSWDFMGLKESAVPRGLSNSWE